MTADRPLLGIVLMLGFCVLAPLADSIAKLLSDSLTVAELLLVRFGVQAMLLWPLARAARLPLLWRPRVTALVLVRTALHMAGLGLMFAALRHLPLADAIAIAFVMPFILLILGRVLLDEEVGTRRIAACLLGFAGTLCVVQPSFAEVGPPALLPLGVALAFALFMLVTRRIARETDPVALQCSSGWMALAVLVPFAVLAPDEPFAGVAPADAWLVAALGLVGTAGHLLMSWSLRFAPAATLAPMQYLEIPVATLFGWLIFRDFPDGLALFGIAVTIGAGLYIVARERRVSRSGLPPGPPAAPPAA